jgi:TrmH family RNA methyltransferase
MASFAVVLVSPERPANVGAAARALKNFDVTDLRVVGADHALSGGAGFGEARALAWNATDVLESATRHASLDDAVDDLHLVAAASGRPGPDGSVMTPREFAEEIARLPADARAGCVFGPEDHGLSNEELDLCRVRVRIPTSTAQPSLNLAQAVVVIAYEVAMARFMGTPPEAGETPATEGEMSRLCESFRGLALDAGFLNPQAPEHLLGEIRRLVSRARPTHRELTILQGLVAQLSWAQRNGPRKTD